MDEICHQAARRPSRWRGGFTPVTGRGGRPIQHCAALTQRVVPPRAKRAAIVEPPAVRGSCPGLSRRRAARDRRRATYREDTGDRVNPALRPAVPAAFRVRRGRRLACAAVWHHVGSFGPRRPCDFLRFARASLRTRDRFMVPLKFEIDLQSGLMSAYLVYVNQSLP